MSDIDVSHSINYESTLESGRGQHSTPESPAEAKCNTHLVRFGWIWAQSQLFFTSWFDLALVIIPMAWDTHFTPVPSYVAFFLNLIVIIPLARVTSKLTEELAKQSNLWTAALWNVSLGYVLLLFFALARGTNVLSCSNIVEIFIAVLSVCSDNA
jgi:Na+/citrate or Na+/malate symporter